MLLLKSFILILTIFFNSTVIACAFHGSANFQDPSIPAYSNYIFIKTEAQITNGKLESIPQLDDAKSYARAYWWMVLLEKTLHQSYEEPLYIYVADIGLWALFDNNNDTTMMIDTPPPHHDSILPVMVLTQPTLNALISEKLTLEQARKLDIIAT